MALSTKLELRQSQSLVMTPQLQQAIKLLQLSNLELTQFVETELERNPLLERDEDGPDLAAEPDRLRADGSGEAVADGDDAGLDTWLASEGSSADAARELDTDYENIDTESIASEVARLADPGWTSVGSGAGSSDADGVLEATATAELTLHDHLMSQLGHAPFDPTQRMIAVHLIDLVDESGYVRGDLFALADRLGAPPAVVESVLGLLQDFDPAGVFARDLAECLALQLRDQNRYDPVIARLLDNLDMLARHDLSGLRRVCNVDADELTEMIHEIKALNPKPGLQFGSVNVQPVIPDVLVMPRNDGSWYVELNAETLPRVLVNRQYFATVSKGARRDDDKSYLSECLQTANWLVKSLDQRARTILRVSQEIIRQQDAFLAYGVQHLRPLNLKTVADAISMHESTISRVTSNKYMATPRGVFELKYFFTSSIASSESGEAHSSEAVRHRIRQLIDGEKPSSILSDDRIVILLRDQGVDIARRTVAKYREAMHIPSSVQRRRQKQMALVGAKM